MGSVHTFKEGNLKVRMRCRRLAIAVFSLAFVSAPLLANPHRQAVIIGAGALDVLRHARSVDFSLEYRFHSAGRFQPQLIGTWSTDGSRFVGAGLLLHATPARNWDIAVGFAPGYYEREHGPALGSSLEFFSSIELSRALRKGRRIGLHLGHISNGSFGDANPGAETIRLFWAIPIGH
jgi:hypothetical protein